MYFKACLDLNDLSRLQVIFLTLTTIIVTRRHLSNIDIVEHNLIHNVLLFENSSRAKNGNNSWLFFVSLVLDYQDKRTYMNLFFYMAIKHHPTVI